MKTGPMKTTSRLLELIQEIERNNNDLGLFFEFNGFSIYFPTIDEEATYPVDPVSYYGKNNIASYVLSYFNLKRR
ncbi:hypothetical protein D5E69_22995 (plasmid) [Rossellomorea marisflavi]|uniref:hypothetical protein n=1 Tax=Rossellomorea marisflavi TaxID=189381 RepID=UPI001316ED00|nr:hypothetical protein [Rossellomorea marisflavi]QHA38705.1 hypothetical protein D5E69_22995 [Rossellomorea marisflavi]